MTIAGDLRTLEACEQVFKPGQRTLQALRRAGQQCRRDPRRQFPRTAGRRLDRRLRAEVSRRGAADPVVLAAAQGRARQRGQHRRRRRAHAGAGIPHRRRGQRGLREFRQGPHRARQPRRHQRQRHPSRADADRPRRAAVRSNSPRRRTRRWSRCAPRRWAKAACAASASRRMSPRSRCFCAARGRDISTAPRSPSMAAARRGTTRRRSSSRYRSRAAAASCEASSVRKAACAVSVTFGSFASG